MKWDQGSVAALTATFVDVDAEAFDPPDLTVAITSPKGTHVSGEVPIRKSVGNYVYFLDLTDAPLGTWDILWSGTGATATESFQVIEPGSVIPSSEAEVFSILRSRLGEPKTGDTDGSETMFSDDDLSEILLMSGLDLDVSTLEGWKRKAARLQRLVDVQESGTNRNMSQKFRQALQMVELWSGLVSDGNRERQSALNGRVVGKPVNLRCDPDENPLTPFSGYSDHIRTYPTHRLLIPAILG